MFSKETATRIGRLFTQDGTNAQRVSQHSKGLLLLLQSITTALVTVKALWDNGFAQQLTAAADNTIVNGATKRWWKLAQAAFLIYATFMKLPFSTLAALSIPDGQGGTIQPFAVFDAEELGELANLSFEQIAFSEPETTLQIIEEEEIPNGE